MVKKRRSPAQKAAAKAGSDKAAQKIKASADVALAVPLCSVFGRSVSKKTTQVKHKKAMPNGVVRRPAGRPVGISDSVVRKPREVSPVKAAATSNKRKAPAISHFAFADTHKRNGSSKAITQFRPGAPCGKGPKNAHEHRALVPFIEAPTYADAEVISQFLCALSNKGGGKPQELESACAALLSAAPAKTPV